MNATSGRRQFLLGCGVLALARDVMAVAGAGEARVGICTFSCHRRWRAARDGNPLAGFDDAPGFYRYARGLGAEGVQTRVSGDSDARSVREMVERDGGYYEGDVRLPEDEGEVAGFAAAVRRCREAGAEVVRTVMLGGRRYEVFKSRAEFEAFRAGALRSLELAEPVVREQRMKLAVENHKDFTAESLAAMVRALGSEWVGVLVDTGNNIALLDDPHRCIETLAPLAMSVHLKDMAVQPDEDGFLLSEVPLGTGMLDLGRVVGTLAAAKRDIVFNLEMATRDPLKVPCLTGAYWATFGGRDQAKLDAAMAMVAANPPRQPPPIVSGKGVEEVLRDEEANNRNSLAWMNREIR